MSQGRLLSRLLGRDEDDSMTYSAEEIETRGSSKKEEPGEVQQPRGFSIQRIAETVADLPSTVPREHAVLIVRRTLAAAGIKFSEVDVSTRALESELSSEIELARNQQKDVREKTAETVRSLEEEIRRAQETCDGIVAFEEKKISRATATLKEVRRVRDFFDLPEMEGEKNTGRIDKGAQVLEPLTVGRTTPLVRERSGPLGDSDDTTSHRPIEGSSMYGGASDTSEE
jgi:hypothetical protein